MNYHSASKPLVIDFYNLSNCGMLLSICRQRGKPPSAKHNQRKGKKSAGFRNSPRPGGVQIVNPTVDPSSPLHQSCNSTTSCCVLPRSFFTKERKLDCPSAASLQRSVNPFETQPSEICFVGFVFGTSFCSLCWKIGHVRTRDATPSQICFGHSLLWNAGKPSDFQHELDVCKSLTMSQNLPYPEGVNIDGRGEGFAVRCHFHGSGACIAR